ncbi:hypothetical protein [Streptomyces sp. NPDC101234]
MVDSAEIYIDWYAGRSKSALAGSLGVDPEELEHLRHHRRR